jgi:hypothetical protein
MPDRDQQPGTTNRSTNKSSNPNNGNPINVAPPFKVMTMEEPIIKADVTIPTVMRLAASLAVRQSYLIV